jgi:ATP-dependent RNA helicase DDX41
MITHDPLPINPQADREAAIDAFKKGEKDVLVATDVASKGLDFADIQHVVNYDM